MRLRSISQASETCGKIRQTFWQAFRIVRLAHPINSGRFASRLALEARVEPLWIHQHPHQRVVNMLGHCERFTAVPFFWSQHYDIPINYVGHADKWDELAIEGDIAAKDCVLRFKRNGRMLAVASIFRDLEASKPR